MIGKQSQYSVVIGQGREERIMAVYDQMERGYTLLGATAVEDKLQVGQLQ